MSSILKVDTIQDQSGNNIINESGNVITIGASGDTITVPAGATVSGFTSAGIDDNATSTAITISSAENVGIGTASPSQPLHVYSTGNEIARIETNQTEGRLSLKDATGDAILKFRNDFRFTNSSGELVRINSSGNVGINNSAPTVPLEVNGAVKFNEAPGASSGTVIIDGSATGNPQLRYYQNGTVKGYLTYWDSSDTLALTDGSANGLHFSPSTQRVGIGTSSPDDKFHVMRGDSGGTAVGGSVITAENGGNCFVTFLGASTSNCTLFLGDNINNNAGQLDYDHANDSMSFYTNQSEKVRITSAGSVGIGTASPGTTLDVAGDATITKNDTPLYLNRTGSDGEVLRFSKDGTAFGLVGVSSTKMHIGTGNANFRFRDDLTAIIPANANGSNSDNDIDLGYSTVRWRRLYLSEGVFLGGTGTANKLDDYEEGSFTPSFSASGCSFNYTQRFGNYTKIGRVVHCKIFLRAQSTGSTSQDLKITGLPFTSSNTNGLFASCTFGQIYKVDLTDAERIVGQLSKNNTTIDLQFTVDDSVSGNLVASALDNSTSSGFVLDITYFTDA